MQTAVARNNHNEIKNNIYPNSIEKYVGYSFVSINNAHTNKTLSDIDNSIKLYDEYRIKLAKLREYIRDYGQHCEESKILCLELLKLDETYEKIKNKYYPKQNNTNVNKV